MGGGYKRRLSSTSILGPRARSPSNYDNPVEEIVDEEWVEQRPAAPPSSRQYLSADRDAPTVLAKRHLVRFRGSSQATTPEQRAAELGSVDSIDRHVTFEEEQSRGRYSLEVEDSVAGRRHSRKNDEDEDDRDEGQRFRSKSRESERGRSKDCCEVPMDNCHHHHHRHSVDNSVSNRAPIIIVEPHTDESTHCEHCQFFSGWFCCIPFIVFILLSLLVVYLCFRHRIHRMLDDWRRSSMSMDDELYWATEPMELEQTTSTTVALKLDEREGEAWLPFKGFG